MRIATEIETVALAAVTAYLELLTAINAEHAAAVLHGKRLDGEFVCTAKIDEIADRASEACYKFAEFFPEESEEYEKVYNAHSNALFMHRAGVEFGSTRREVAEMTLADLCTLETLRQAL